jgi:hypothetical protein
MHEFIFGDQHSAVSVFERRREEDSWKYLLFTQLTTAYYSHSFTPLSNVAVEKY